MVRIWTDRCDYKFTDTFQDFSATEDKRIEFIAELRARFRVAERIPGRHFFQSVRFAGGGGFVGFYIMPFGKNTINRDQIAGFQM